MSISSLFSFHSSSNTVYAIAPLENLFFEAGLELSGGDARDVHFAYRRLATGRPVNLPNDFENIIEFDFREESSEKRRQFVEYVRQKGIDFVLFLDIQPLDPLFKSLRHAGARTIMSYWGSPISSAMPLWKLQLKKLQFAFSRSKIDALIFESQAMADLAIHGRGVPPGIIDLVPLGVDTSLFRPGATDHVYQVTGLPQDRKVVIYVGHMEARKGVRTLIEAAIELLVARRRKDVCFLIFGNRQDQSLEFERMYEGRGIENLIRFGGYRGDLAQIYPCCFCGVIPSTGWDSYPRSSIEMAACGLPVVASRLQGLCEAVLDKQTGLLFEPGNASELADCLEVLLDNPLLAKQYGTQGRRRCETELNLLAQRDRFLHVLRKRLGLL